MTETDFAAFVKELDDFIDYMRELQQSRIAAQRNAEFYANLRRTETIAWIFAGTSIVLMMVSIVVLILVIASS